MSHSHGTQPGNWVHHHYGGHSEKMQVLLEPMLSASLLVKTPGLVHSQIFTFFKLQSIWRIEHPQSQAANKRFISTSDSTSPNKLVVIPQLSSNCTKRSHFCFSWASGTASDWSHPSALLSLLRSCFTFALTYCYLGHTARRPFSWPASSTFPSKPHTPVNQPSHLPFLPGAISLYLLGNPHIPSLISGQLQQPPRVPTF